jgi:hypothetical protein
MRRRSKGALLVAVALVYPCVAAAQSPSREPLAEALFRDGKTLMAEGHFAEACPKLAESVRLDPALGALLAVAFCHEKEGKTATAWSEFLTARSLAEKANEVERERLARLLRVTITVRPEMQSVEGFVVRQNGASLTKATWGVAGPVDPGEQVIEATAPGRRPWMIRFAVQEGDPTHAIEVPALEPNAPPLPALAVTARAPEVARVPESRAGRTWGYAIGGIGIASVAAGTYFGFRAIGKNDDAKALCSPTSCSSAEGIDRNSEARSSATISTIAIAGGLAAIGVGAILVLRSRASGPRHEAALRILPLAGPGGLGAGMRGAW